MEKFHLLAYCQPKKRFIKILTVDLTLMDFKALIKKMRRSNNRQQINGMVCLSTGKGWKKRECLNYVDFEHLGKIHFDKLKKLLS